ncbi:MAG TPA: hypothetical protein VL854_09045 [Nitrososphaeraceae archaeon]|nr:hypothetical protein [Nitrososphaeraceae archaeon]
MTDRKCHCGCDQFRFNLLVSDVEPMVSNTCSNCDHTLGEHIRIVRSAQAE